MTDGGRIGYVSDNVQYINRCDMYVLYTILLLSLAYNQSP
jgi:hypothetical protein